MEKIVAAAISFGGVTLSVEKPERHHHIIQFMADLDIPKRFRGPEFQGFITSEGKFVDREEAKEIVDKNGQRIAEHATVLTSEDLW